jgi:hypothetical protein
MLTISPQLYSSWSNIQRPSCYAIMGRSLRPLFNGTADKIYGPNDIVADEMFNSSAVYMEGVSTSRHITEIDYCLWSIRKRCWCCNSSRRKILSCITELLSSSQPFSKVTITSRIYHPLTLNASKRRKLRGA